MPTEKPRVTITVSEDQLKEIEDYRYGHKMKNQTQAILSLVRVGLNELSKGSSEVECVPLNTEPCQFSPKELSHLKKYRTLDEYGKKAVDGALEVQMERVNSKPDLSAMSEDEILAEMERRETRRLGAAAKGGKSVSVL